MRINCLAAILFAEIATGSPVDYVLSALAPYTPCSNTTAPHATPNSSGPTPSSIPSLVQEVLELRQAPGFAPVDAPPAMTVAIEVPDWKSSITTATPPPAAAVPPAEEAVPPAPPVAPLPPVPATMTVPGVPPQLTGDDFVTVQWIETHIGTLRTWVPQTETFHFEAMSQAPLPGVGSIGMGTLTGKTGQTQTI